MALRGPGIAALVLILAALVLAGCTSAPAPAPLSEYPAVAVGPDPVVASPAPRPLAPAPSARLDSDATSLSALPGWDEDDHLAALLAFRDGCGVARSADWKAACTAARALADPDERTARHFLETRFVVQAGPVAPPGVLTAYFAPEYEAQSEPDEIFCAPVLPRPLGRSALPDRIEIEATPQPAAPAYMKAEDLFFMQIQGPMTASEAFDAMLEKAQYIAQRLHGIVGDEQRTPLSPQRMRAIRERMLNYDFAHSLQSNVGEILPTHRA